MTTYPPRYGLRIGVGCYVRKVFVRRIYLIKGLFSTRYGFGETSEFGFFIHQFLVDMLEATKLSEAGSLREKSTYFCKQQEAVGKNILLQMLKSDILGEALS